MSSLTNEQKQLLFDYSLGMTSESESAEAQAVISSNPDAAEIYRSLKSVLAPLDSIEPEPCPDDLADRTVAGLSRLANSGRQGLEQLIADEQTRPPTIRIGFWRNFREVAAVAAAILLVASVLWPLLGRQRQRYWKQRCQAQLSSIFQGLSNYASDHDGMSPAAANPSRQWNTQCLYLLLKRGYIKDTAVFICPGRDGDRPAKFDISRVGEYDDFPARGYVTYSPRKMCPDSLAKPGLCAGPVLSDRNPMFEIESRSFNFNRFKRYLDEVAFKANSRNHRSKGQNILYHDGRVMFMEMRRATFDKNGRFIGVGDEDIFALRAMRSGDEVGEREQLPSSLSDIFLAP